MHSLQAGRWALTGWALAVFAFLYLPIVIVVVYAFNDNREVTLWSGFSTRWFGEALNDPIFTDAVRVSLKIALVSAALSTVLGTAAALALARVRRAARLPFEAMTYLALAVPEIVIAVATLTYFVQIRANDPTGLFPPLGWMTIVLAHTVFGTAVVTLVVRARLAGMGSQLEEASADLGAGRVVTFRTVTLPQLSPAILAGYLLSFVFSFDDYVLTVFTAGTTQTWPMVIYSSVRFGITPKVNAMATMMLLVTLAAGVAAALLLRRTQQRRQAPQPGGRSPHVPAPGSAASSSEVAA